LQQQDNEDDKKQDDMYSFSSKTMIEAEPLNSCSSKTMRMTRSRKTCTVAGAGQ